MSIILFALFSMKAIFRHKVYKIGNIILAVHLTQKLIALYQYRMKIHKEYNKMR